jgi:hypothetical protein
VGEDVRPVDGQPGRLVGGGDELGDRLELRRGKWLRPRAADLDALVDDLVEVDRRS